MKAAQKHIALIDHTLGNLESVKKAFRFLGYHAVLTKSERKIRDSCGIVVPGVGAFGDAVRNLRKDGLFELIIDEVKNGKPYLGICLGLQLLFERSEEDKRTQGLALLKGEVIRFRTSRLKIPHIGWNQIEIVKRDQLFAPVKNHEFFYFVHSYYVVPRERKVIASYTNYGKRFVSSVAHDHIWGVQFHPEKSQRPGLHLIQQYAEFCLQRSTLPRGR